VLCARADAGWGAARGPSTPSDVKATTRLRELASEHISVERSTLEIPRAWSPPPAEPAALEAAEFARELDLGWRRTSFSDITAGAYEARVGSEPEEVLIEDEPAAPSATARGDEPAWEAEAPAVLDAMPVGTRVGTFVHRVLEATDFAAPDLDAALAAHVEQQLARRRIDAGDPAHVVAGLRAAIETPLGPGAQELRLRDVGRRDRLDELAFELPLAGGDEPTGRLTLDAIAATLAEHLPAGDPLAGYGARLADASLRHSVRGFLTGSLDLVLRLPDGRFAVADYKTNWLAPPGAALGAWHHRPTALAAEMVHAHYALQALLYQTALHRYLRWRLPGYDPDRHLAGVLYLFLRGMIGADVPRVDGLPCGVFAWRPPGAMIAALSDVLDRGAA